MFKQHTLRSALVFACSIFFANSWAQDAKIVVGGNATARDTVNTHFYLKDGLPFTVPMAVGTSTLSVVNNLGGTNNSAAPYSLIGSGKNDSIYGSADYGIVLGGKNNVIENHALPFNPSLPPPVNPSAHNFISSGEFNRIKENANHAAIIGGRNNTIATGAANAIILGGSNITATQANTAYMQNVAITDLALSGSGYRMLMIDSMGNITASQQKNKNSILGNGPWQTGGNSDNAEEYLGTNDPFGMIIGTSTLPRMRITKDGNIGINTTPNSLPSVNVNNPYKLDILGNVRVIIGTGTTSDNIVFKTDKSPVDGTDEAKVGIGTESPIRALHIVTKHKESNINATNPSCPTCLTGPHNGLRIEDDFKPLAGGTINTIWDIAPKPGMLVIGTGKSNDPFWLGSEMVILNSNGYVGLGTAFPLHKLEVHGSMSVYDPTPNPGTGDISLFFGQANATGNTRGKWGIQYVAPGVIGSHGGLNFWIPALPGNNFGNNYLFLADGGNVGIGTAAPNKKLDVAGDAHILGPVYIGDKTIISGPHQDYMLAVNGKMVAKSAYVTLTGWGDFVFDKEYKRMNWQEKKDFFNKNMHLPGMPAANEIETQGLNVGDAMKIVTINVEENSLDIVDLYQRFEKLEQENQQLKAEITQLKKKP